MQARIIKSFLLLPAIFLGITAAEAQQLFKVSNYMDRNYVVNPAAVGANGNTSIGVSYRNQWNGIDGGPVTAILFGDTYFAKMNTGLGMILYSDKTGPTRRSGGEVNLSYSVKLGGENKRLLFGLGAQVIQFSVDKEKIADAIPNDPLLASSGNTTKADAQAGVFYRSDKLNIGFAAKQLIQPKLNFIKTASNPEGRLYRHYSAFASYDIRTDEANILQPHIEVRFMPNAPADYEGGITLYHKDLFHVGVSAHYRQAYTLFAGLKFMHRFSINYAYDVYKDPVSIFETGYAAHEIMLRYFFIK